MGGMRPDKTIFKTTQEGKILLLIPVFESLITSQPLITHILIPYINIDKFFILSQKRTNNNTNWQYFQYEIKVPTVWPEGKKARLEFTGFRGLGRRSR